MPRLVEMLLLALLCVMLFGFGFLVGAGRGMDLVRQQAIDEGWAERDSGGVFRWRTTDDIRR